MALQCWKDSYKRGESHYFSMDENEKEKTIYWGQLRDLGIEDQIQSIHVANGFIVHCFADRNTDGWRVSFAGGSSYLALWKTFGDVFGWNKNGISTIKIVRNENANENQCVKVWARADRPTAFTRVPLGTYYGTWNCGSSSSTDTEVCFYPNDSVDCVEVPTGYQASLYKDGTDGSKEVVGEGHYSLFDMGIGDMLTVMKVDRVGYKEVKTDYLPIVDKQETVVYTAQDQVSNPTQSEQDGINDTFSQEFSKTSSVSFEAGVELGITQSISYGGEASPVQGSTEVSVTTSISAGKSTEKSETTTVSKGYALKARPGYKTTATFIVKKVSGKIPFITTLQDDRGHQRQVKGYLDSDLSYSGIVDYKETKL